MKSDKSIFKENKVMDNYMFAKMSSTLPAKYGFSAGTSVYVV